MRSSRKILGVLLMLVMLLVVGCSQASEEAVVSAEEVTPVVDEDAEIVISGTRNIAPGEKDAYYCSSILMVWEPLLTKSANGSPVAKLAEAYEANEDFTEWTFYLREGVKFHDGEAFDADAVIANFDRMKLGKKSSSYYSMDITKTYPGLNEVVKVDEHTVKLIFDKSLPTLDFSMTDFGSAMFSPKGFDEEGNFNGMVQGTGPFKMVKNRLDEYAIIERNDAYYGEKAMAKMVKIRVIPDPDTRFSALKAGEIMGVIDLGAIQPVMAMELIKDEQFGISYHPNTITHYMIVNGNKAPFDDMRMRKAVSLLIDRQQIVDSFYAGIGTPTTNVLNPLTPFHQELPIEHDVEKAKALAKEVLGDERMSISIVLRSGELARYPNKEEAELLQSQLSEIGLDATITLLDNGAWNEAVNTGNYDLSLKIKGLSSSEPRSLFSSMMKTSSGLNKKWSFGYSNEEVDQLIDEVANEMDMEKRKNMYNRLQEISVEELPAIPYFDDMNLVAFNKSIEGYNASYYGVTLDKMRWAK